jgi:hypothetical protein
MDKLLSSQRLEDPSAERGNRRLPGRSGQQTANSPIAGDELAAQADNSLGEAWLIRLPAVQERVGMGRTAVYELIKARQVSTARQGRCGECVDRCRDHALDRATRSEPRHVQLTVGRCHRRVLLWAFTGASINLREQLFHPRQRRNRNVHAARPSPHGLAASLPADTQVCPE